MLTAYQRRGNLTVKGRAMQTCNRCDGSGHIGGYEIVDCGLPDGNGPWVELELDCPKCGAWGYTDGDDPGDDPVDCDPFPQKKEAQIEVAYIMRELELHTIPEGELYAMYGEAVGPIVW